MSPRHLLRGAAVTAAAAALIAASAVSPALAHGNGGHGQGNHDHAGSGGPADINGYRSVGYLMADTPVTRDYQIEDLLRTGAIDDVTHINYAFGNVTTNLKCEITDVPGEGDAQNDYLRLVSAADSVDGKKDKANKHQRLAGNFNQLKKLKEVSPDTKVLISLGGWTWSDNFSEAASTPESRAALVSSCIDVYLKGDLPKVGTLGGPGAAAGIFDGIDVDWEWPVNGGETANAKPEDKENFLALMEEFRAQLDAYGAETGEDYLLTAFGPAGGWNTNAGGWNTARLFDSIDWLNVQGYDYAGGWTGNTGHQGNLHPDGANNWGLAIDNAIALYTAGGARPDQLNVGLAAYGQGWTGVTAGDRAGWTPDPAVTSLGTKPYYEIRDLGEAYFDPALGASWRYDAASGQWWSLDDPNSVTAKAEWLAAQGYGGAMWWDLSGDYRGELGNALGDALRSAEEGPLD
jgi:chitinase